MQPRCAQCINRNLTSYAWHFIQSMPLGVTGLTGATGLTGVTGLTGTTGITGMLNVERR